MSSSARATIALSIHGPAGVLDLVVPAGATAVDVAREYAKQADVPGIPLLQTALGERLNAAVPLGEAGIQPGDVLVATTGVHRPRRVTLLQAAKNAPESPALAAMIAWVAAAGRRPRRVVRRSRGRRRRTHRRRRGAARLLDRRRAAGRSPRPTAGGRRAGVRRGRGVRGAPRARRPPAPGRPRCRRHRGGRRRRHRPRPVGRRRRGEHRVDRQRPHDLRLLRRPGDARLGRPGRLDAAGLPLDDGGALRALARRRRARRGAARPRPAGRHRLVGPRQPAPGAPRPHRGRRRRHGAPGAPGLADRHRRSGRDHGDDAGRQPAAAAHGDHRPRPHRRPLPGLLRGLLAAPRRPVLPPRGRSDPAAHGRPRRPRGAGRAPRRGTRRRATSTCSSTSPSGWA